MLENKNMDRKPQSPPPPPELDGYFYTIRNKRSFIRVEGHQVSYHEAGREVFSAMRIEFGEFGAAHDRMTQVSGIKNLNIKLLVFFDQNDPKKRVASALTKSVDFKDKFVSN